MGEANFKKIFTVLGRNQSILLFAGLIV